MLSTHSARVKKRFLALVAACAFIFSIGAARALDSDEVRTLVQNQVPEEVILNMIRTDGTIYITLEEAEEFRALGASENLVAALRPTATTTTATAPTASAAALSSSGAPTIIMDEPTVVAPAPTVAYGTSALVESAMPADGAPVTPVAITNSTPYPPRYAKEGWIVFSNHDWSPYYLSYGGGNKRMFLSKFPNGGVEIASGSSVVVNVRKESYKLYGDSGEDLKIKVRENETTTVALNPFGVFGNSGLTGVSVDRDKVRSEVLFRNYVPAPQVVVVEEPPVVVVPGPPMYYHPRRRHDSFYFRYNHW